MLSWTVRSRNERSSRHPLNPKLSGSIHSLGSCMSCILCGCQVSMACLLAHDNTLNKAVMTSFGEEAETLLPCNQPTASCATAPYTRCQYHTFLSGDGSLNNCQHRRKRGGS